VFVKREAQPDDVILTTDNEKVFRERPYYHDINI